MTQIVAENVWRTLVDPKYVQGLPGLNAYEELDEAHDYGAVQIQFTLENESSGWMWHVTEIDSETGFCFGVVEGDVTELGYFGLNELAGMNLKVEIVRETRCVRDVCDY